jgi:deazaflavin-dependent oxidoreductase (nitroreductase family)
VSGRPHRIEIWFSRQGRTVYLLSGGRESADWVRNLETTPEVTIEVGERMWSGTARVLDPGTDEDALARRLVHGKYAPRDSSDLTEWGRTSLPVAIDLAAEG